MATAAQRRRVNERMNLNMARAAAPAIAKVIRRERKRVARATANATTPAEWERAARSGVLDSEWVAVFVDLWTSPRMEVLWRQVQDDLGTDFPMDGDTRRRIIQHATRNAMAHADSRRDRLTRLAAANG